jgi:hypothetical protein
VSSRWCAAGCLIERLFYSDKKMQQMRFVFLYILDTLITEFLWEE